MPGPLFDCPPTVKMSIRHWVAVPEVAVPAVASGSAILKLMKSNLYFQEQKTCDDSALLGLSVLRFYLSEGLATKKIKGKNHKRSESSRKNQPVGEKNQNKNQLWISKENLPLVIIYIAFYMKLIWVPSLTSWPNERMKLPLVLICMGFDRKLIFDVTARRAIKKLLGFKES